MISTNRVFTAVQALLNKDERSAITPTEYNNFSSLALMDILDEARMTIQSIKMLMTVGKEDLERRKYAQECLNAFYVPDTIAKSGDTYPKPTDIVNVDKIYYEVEGDDGEIYDYEIERLRSFKDIQLLKKMGRHLSPYGQSQDMNLYYLDSGDIFQVYPEDFAEEIKMYYYRAPKVPKWTYSVVSNTAVYDGTRIDKQDFELPEQFFDNVVLKIAAYCGVTIRDISLIQSIDMLNKEESKEEHS